MGTHRQLGDWARARCCERCVRESFTWNAREASPHFSAPPPPNLESSSPKSSFLPKGLLALARRAFPSQACSCPSTGPAHPKSGRPAESQSRAGAKPAVRRVVCELRRGGGLGGRGCILEDSQDSWLLSMETRLLFCRLGVEYIDCFFPLVSENKTRF